MSKYSIELVGPENPRVEYVNLYKSGQYYSSAGPFSSALEADKNRLLDRDYVGVVRVLIK